MMHQFKRYAIYYLPQDIALSEAGAEWLGWDVLTGQPIDRPQNVDLDVVATPQKYGFHATLKAPFRLRDGSSLADLSEGFRSLAPRLAPVTITLELARLGRFFALVNAGNSSELNQLASTLVKDLDHFRAPLTQADIERRRPETLSQTQRAYLMQWGYPFVMDDFKFHMTLSGRLTPSQMDHLQSTLSTTFAPFLNCAHTIESICLVGENQDGYFELIERAHLGG